MFAKWLLSPRWEPEISTCIQPAANTLPRHKPDGLHLFPAPTRGTESAFFISTGMKHKYYDSEERFHSYLLLHINISHAKTEVEPRKGLSRKSGKFNSWKAAFFLDNSQWFSHFSQILHLFSPKFHFCFSRLCTPSLCKDTATKSSSVVLHKIGENIVIDNCLYRIFCTCGLLSWIQTIMFWSVSSLKTEAAIRKQ